MALQSELEDPLKRWLKGGLSTKLLKKGLENFVDKAIKNLQIDFLTDIRNFKGLSEVTCIDCTTANCLPCPTKDICIVTGKGRTRQCYYHVKNDITKEYRPCPNGICEPSLRGKILAQHQYNNPTWKNTDASKWCSMHWEIAKCFMPPGYGDKLSTAETDCSGLLHVIMNCAYVQKYMDRRISSGHFTQILNFRNKIFHSASLSLDQDELDRHIGLMIEILQDQKTLAQDTDAQNAVDLLTQLKSGTLIVSLKDESEIRAEQQAAYQARKLELQSCLCEIYDDNFRTIPISPLLDEVEDDIDDVVVDMIVCDESIEGFRKNWRDFNLDIFQYAKETKMGKIIENYTGIFFKEDKSCKNIYISGEAGMGKTTWCLKMLRTWITALNKLKADPQTDTLTVDEEVMSKFDIVFFVSLRYAVNNGNIRDMIPIQLYQERPKLDLITSEVFEKEANKCLVILDGFDEWSPPDNFINTSTLQNSQTPGRKDLYGCPVLTTTRSYKLHQVRLRERDVDNAAKIQGLKDYEGFAERVINLRRKEAGQQLKQVGHLTYHSFCQETERSFKKKIFLITFMRLPLILIFMICSWLDNGKLETTWAGNFSGFLECMISAAEQKRRLYGIKGLADLKNEWSKHKSYLPQMFQDRRHLCKNYSLLFVNISKLAFHTLFDEHIQTKLFIPEELANKWLSSEEIEVAIKVGILSQIKVIGKTLTRTSSLSFLHKTIQEHLAAVHLCSKTDDQKEALKIFRDCCSDDLKIGEYEQILMNVFGMIDIPTAYYVSQKIIEIYGMVFFRHVKETELETPAHKEKRKQMFTAFNKEIEEANNVSQSSMRQTHIAKLSNSSNENLKLEIIQTPLRVLEIPEESRKQYVSETFTDLQETQTWLPNHWSSSENSQLIALITKQEKDNENQINLSHCENLEIVSFIDMSVCDINLSQTKLNEITTKRVINCSLHINKTVESSKLIRPPLKVIKLKGTNNCTITLSDAKWKIDQLKFNNCNSCKVVIETDGLASNHVSKIDRLCLVGQLQNIQLEKENFKLPINHLMFTNYNLKTMSNSFERYLYVYLRNVKVVSIIEMPDTEENWTTLEASIPYLPNMEEFSLSVGKENSNDIIRFSSIQSSALHSLQYASKLKSLKLIDPSETKCNALALALPHLTLLEKIDIDLRCYLSMRLSSRIALFDSMKWLPFLTDITLHGVTDGTFRTLHTVLPYLKKLMKFDLDWTDINSDSNCDIIYLNVMSSLQHVKGLREIHLTLPTRKGETRWDMCLPPLPLLEKLFIKNRGRFDPDIPEKLLSSISNLPNVRQLHLNGVSKENIKQVYQVLPKLTNLQILVLTYRYKFDSNPIANIDWLGFIASLPNINNIIGVICDDPFNYYFEEFDDFNEAIISISIKYAITKSSRFTLQRLQVSSTRRSVGFTLLPISNKESTTNNV